MKRETVNTFLLGLMCGALIISAIGFVFFESITDDFRQELIASRNDALEYRASNVALEAKLDESLAIISGSQSIINGTITTVREALDAVRKCRGIILALESVLQN